MFIRHSRAFKRPMTAPLRFLEMGGNSRHFFITIEMFDDRILRFRNFHMPLLC
jgi:hypothetical protein